jgi:hypothetical protein
MFDQRTDQMIDSRIRVDLTLGSALERASRAIARLDQALDRHPLLPAFLYRIRLEAVRRQAAVDGQLIDPWHLAAVLEGLRLSMEHAMRIIDRGVIFEAARHALAFYWLRVFDFVDPVECEQLVGGAGSLYRCNDSVTLATKNQRFIILNARVLIAMTTSSRSASRESTALAEVA